MKALNINLVLLLALFSNFITEAQPRGQNPMVICFDKPAYQNDTFSYKSEEFTNSFYFSDNGWNEALPIGNGRLGAMVFGGVARERIQLNEESLWEGFYKDSNNPEAFGNLKDIQKLMFEGLIDSAESIAAKSLIGQPENIGSYQSLGDLFIQQVGVKGKQYSNYSRMLNIDSAISITRYNYDGVNYRREIFASHPRNIIALRFSSDKPRSISLKINLTRERDARTTGYKPISNCIMMEGRIDCTDEKGNPKGLKFASVLKASTKDGKIRVSNDGTIDISNASDVIVYFTAATNFKGIEPKEYCFSNIKEYTYKNYPSILKEHIVDYRSLYSRVKIGLGHSNTSGFLQDVRLQKVKEDNNDTYLSELLFQYSRYLLISCSREGDLPANLQGIWNQSTRPPWGSDYHTNINLQMNYMAAEAVNLPECVLPLFELMDTLAVYGKSTANKMYNSRGWVVHHLTDIFGRTSPADGTVGIWPMGAGWLSFYLYDHYLYSGDKEFLKKRAYPLMKGAAEFLLDFLTPIPEGLPNAGKLVTNPSHSPENAYETKAGSQYQFTYGAAMDMQICHHLFNNCLDAVSELSVNNYSYDPDFKKRLEEAIGNLAPIKISPTSGGIQEWIEDYKETEIGHRHISHLYALYPAGEISKDTPELFAAARKTLERRLAGNPKAGTEEARNRYPSFGSYLNGKSFGGWQSVWISLLWLRLANAEEAFNHHKYFLKSLYPNMFGWAYQLDGTFGSAAVVSEMLLQSHAGYVDVLPALPSSWSDGFVEGLRARGGFVLSLHWKSMKCHTIEVKSVNGNKCSIKLTTDVSPKIMSEGKEVEFIRKNGNIEFHTEKNKSYTLTFSL